MIKETTGFHLQVYIYIYIYINFRSSLQPSRKCYKLKQMINRSEEASEMAQTQAARFDLLLPEEAG